MSVASIMCRIDRSRIAFPVWVLLAFCVGDVAVAAEGHYPGDNGKPSSLSRLYRVPEDPTLSPSDHDSQVLGQDDRRQTIVNPVEQDLHPAHRQRSARAAKATLPALKQQLLNEAQ